MVIVLLEMGLTTQRPKHPLHLDVLVDAIHGKKESVYADYLMGDLGQISPQWRHSLIALIVSRFIPFRTEAPVMA
jgi:hypothetical protein